MGRFKHLVTQRKDSMTCVEGIRGEGLKQLLIGVDRSVS